MTKIPVLFVIFSGMSILDLAGPMDVFLTANHLAERTVYNLACVSIGEDTKLNCGLTLLPDARGPKHAPPHTLIVPGGPGVRTLCSAEFQASFRALLVGPERIASICTGAYALAEAGALTGRKATTHWGSYEDFALSYPQVRLQRGPIFMKDGPIWTSAGVTAGIDLALAMVAEDLGHSMALRIARHLVMFLKRPGDQSQFSMPLALQATGSHFCELLAWMSSNLTADLTVPALAQRAGMSERSFLRHFTAKVGRSPSKAVEALRLEAGRDFLSTSTLTIKEVAARCGFGNEATFLRRFSIVYGITPGQHRERFKAGSDS